MLDTKSYQLVAKEKKLQVKADELAENTERVAIMTDHLRNVEQEHLHTQALVDAKAREIETECKRKFSDFRFYATRFQIDVFNLNYFQRICVPWPKESPAV